MRATDTDPETAAIQSRVVRALAGADRLRMAMEMSDLARSLAVARLRASYPDYSERRLLLELLRLTLPPAELPSDLR